MSAGAGTTPAVTILLRRTGNVLTAGARPDGPLPDEARRVLEAELSFDLRRYEGGRVRVTRSCLYGPGPGGTLRTPAGFGRRLAALAARRGWALAYEDAGPPPADPDCYRADKALAEARLAYRPRQEECLDAVLSHRCGVIDAVTGFGKMRLIEMVCLALPRARIDVVVRPAEVARKLVRTLSARLPTGLVGDGRCVRKRVTVYLADSLHKSPADADVLLADECHLLAAESYVEHLYRYQRSRNYGFSASPEGRFDGADLRLEGLFGGTIFRLGYPEAAALGLVVPIRVLWHDAGPAPGRDLDRLEGVHHKRHALWRNPGRNARVAAAALAHVAAGRQTLVLVETLEHAAHLAPLLPGFPLVYAASDEADIRRYKLQSLLPAGYESLTRARRRLLTAAFESGELRGAVATGTWEVGVDFAGLEVLVRADAKGSDIASVQAPGRVARLAGGKGVGLVVDFRDRFDRRLARRAARRSRRYGLMGWEEVDADELGGAV